MIEKFNKYENIKDIKNLKISNLNPRPQIIYIKQGEDIRKLLGYGGSCPICGRSSDV